jgi:hypothetical protein
MRKPTTGEPCAGELPARFGGRGGDEPSLPLSFLGVHVVKNWLRAPSSAELDDD